MTANKVQRIVLMPSAFLPSVGGVEQIALNLGKQIQKRGVDVSILVNKYPADLPDSEEIENLAVRRLSLHYPSKARPVRSLFLMRQAEQQLVMELEQLRPQLIHLICAGPNTWYVWRLSRRLRVPVIATLQGERYMDDSGLYQRSRFARWALSNLLKDCSAITACSKYVLDDAAEHFTFEQSRSQVIFNGIDTVELEGDVQPTSTIMLEGIESPFILAVGRFVENKGFDKLIEAFALLKSTHPGVRLVIAGRGSLSSRLSQLVADARLSESVRIIDSPSRQSLIHLYKSCQVFAMPSPREPFGIVCLEAMAAGKPVVAFDGGGPPEFLGDAGLLAESGNTRDFASCLARLLDDPNLRNQKGRQALATSKQFDWQAISDQYIQLYERVASRP